MEYKPGMIVENTGAPQWGPGKIVHISGNKLYIIFRDLEEEMARVFRADSPALRLAAVQSDAILDNLPPLVERNGDWYLPAKRLTLDSLKRKFLHEFPAGFADARYLGKERDYKLAAHLKFQKLLGLRQARELLARCERRELATKALQVLSAVNILSPYESAAFHDAMQDDRAVQVFFETLIKLLDTKPVNAQACEDYFEAVKSLPAERGRVASWPVATVFPYLANAEQHMFMKPEVTQEAAKSLGFDLKYNATPNWATYEALLRMGGVYLELLRPLGARDFVDVQTFIYVSCGGYDKLHAKKKAAK